MLSIIIPTLNEEKNLPNLLKSIERQGLSNPEKLEIIVADAGSQDRTREIAKEFGCKVIKGGLPAKGRNEGAKVAKGDLLLFLDADVVLTENCLKEALKEFQERNLAVASCLFKNSSQPKAVNFICQKIFNFPVCLLENILPHSIGFILVKKIFIKKLEGLMRK